MRDYSELEAGDCLVPAPRAGQLYPAGSWVWLRVRSVVLLDIISKEAGFASQFK